jgi:hypothetical protein
MVVTNYLIHLNDRSLIWVSLKRWRKDIEHRSKHNMLSSPAVARNIISNSVVF